jgi:hypothetical protein
LEENAEDLTELKAVYDQLWADAKTLAKDLKRSIAVTAYACYVTLLVAFTSIISALPYFIRLWLGYRDGLTFFMAIFAVVGGAVIIGFAAKLLQWHSRLDKKYSKLIALETKPGAK